MRPGTVIFDQVWKRFRRGERNDSLRDLIPASVSNLLRRRRGEELAREEFWALRDVSFQLNPGDALGIIGPNGAGKSTALKLLTGILDPTKGHRELHGRVGALIDLSAGFRQDLTGRENVFLRGAILGMKRRETAAKFDEIVEFAGLADFIDTPVKRYSTGMSARLGFAVAAQMQPDVLIVDEVLGVGDLEFRLRCHERMVALKRAGVAIVVVSHNLSSITGLCDRAILLKEGTVAFAGTAEAAVNHYLVSGIARGEPAADDSPRRVPAPRVVGPMRVAASLGPEGKDRRDLAPGDVLSVRLVIAAVHRQHLAADGVLVTHVHAREPNIVASSTRLPIDLGEFSDTEGPLVLHLRLKLNLLRGSYLVRFSLVNPADRTRLRSTAVLVRIKEQFSASGVAHVVTSAKVGIPAVTASAPE